MMSLFLQCKFITSSLTRDNYSHNKWRKKTWKSQPFHKNILCGLGWIHINLSFCIFKSICFCQKNEQCIEFSQLGVDTIHDWLVIQVFTQCLVPFWMQLSCLNHCFLKPASEQQNKNLSILCHVNNLSDPINVYY